MRHRQIKTISYDSAQFFNIVTETTALTAHSISRTHNKWKTDFFSNFFSAFYRVTNTRTRSVNSKRLHSFLKNLTVFTTLNRIKINTNNLNTIFFKNAGLIQLHSHIQTSLSTKIRKQSIRPFLFNNLRNSFNIQWLNISSVRHNRVSHNRSRIRVHKHNLIALFAQSLTSLSTRIVKFTSLPNHNRP